jgi:hypothetical protein
MKKVISLLIIFGVGFVIYKELKSKKQKKIMFNKNID